VAERAADPVVGAVDAMGLRLAGRQVLEGEGGDDLPVTRVAGGADLAQVSCREAVPQARSTR